ncbi:hypothetical protein ACJJTC_011481 [Scirpophaga incertulas]
MLNLVYCAENILSCDVHSVEPCPGENQICIEKTKQCVCKEGFTLVDENCLAPSPDSSSSHTTTTIIVVIFTLALLVCGLVLVFRKYNLVNYIRQQINLRRGNNETFENVMIGQDDPPLSP